MRKPDLAYQAILSVSLRFAALLWLMIDLVVDQPPDGSTPALMQVPGLAFVSAISLPIGTPLYLGDNEPNGCETLV